MPCSCPHLPHSLLLAAPRAFGAAQALAEFRPDRGTSAPPGTRRPPALSGERTPAPGPCWDPGAAATGGMGWMGWDRGAAGCLVIWGCPWQSHIPGMPLSPGELLPAHPVLWQGGGFPAGGAAQPFSDLGLSVCLF